MCIKEKNSTLCLGKCSQENAHSNWALKGGISLVVTREWREGKLGVTTSGLRVFGREWG